MRTFDLWDLKKAQSVLARRTDAKALANFRYFAGDHWQGGKGWIGPRDQGPNSHMVLTLIEEAFISFNAIREVVLRHTTGVLGRELHWKFTVRRDLGTVEVADPTTGETRVEEEQPTEEEQALISEAEAALVTWWDRMESQEILQQMVSAAALSRRGVLRLFVPPGALDENNAVPAGSLTEQLDRIWLQHLGTNEETLELQPPSGTVFIDPFSRQEVGIFIYREDKTSVISPKEPDGIAVAASASTEDRAELTYLDEDGNTVLRIIDARSDVEQPQTLPLGGRLTIYEMTRQALITPQIISQQKALNLSNTMRTRNDVMAGALERILLNAQLPGKFVDDPAAPGGKRFVPDPFYVGAGTTNVLHGVITRDDEGNERITTPSVVYRDPVSPQTFLDSSNASYLNILREANQLHYAIAGDATASGESRKQAREAYEADLRVTAGKVEAAARWVLETVLAMAAYFAGTPGRFEGLRIYVQARIDAGPISPDEMRVAAEMVDKGLWSREMGMSRTGVEDVDAELDRIERERGTQADASSMPGID